MTDPRVVFSNRRLAAFQDAQVGQRYTYRRTFTEGDVAVFCGVTGDFNPFHQDEVFTRDSPFGKRIIPGLLTGSMLTHIGGMLGFLAAEMKFDFRLPVYIGETVTCIVEIKEQDEQRQRLNCTATMTNQDGKTVLEATFSGFPTQPRLRPDTLETT